MRRLERKLPQLEAQTITAGGGERLKEVERRANEVARLAEQKRKPKHQTRDFVENLQTIEIRGTAELMDVFRLRFSEASILREQLENCGGESLVSKITYLRPQSRSDIYDIIDELELMARRL